MTAGKRHKEAGGPLHYLYGIAFIALLVGLYGAIHAIDSDLPAPLTIADEPQHPDAFVAEGARDLLRPLVEIGPRVAGHPNNEIKAVGYLKRTVEDIIGGAHPNQRITYDVQVRSGSFFADSRPGGSVNVYEHVQNVVVKVHAEGGGSPHGVLLNAHFDTVPGSPGGGAAADVAVALEVLRRLSRMAERPTRSVIVLLNGAGEAALCGAHAFVAGHRLAAEARVFVNLGAAGAGGREALVRTGPDEPWLLEYYDVPHPRGSAAGEEVLESGLVPSDTDFRVFGDFGGIVGYDFTRYGDGYRYHTKYDGIDNIDLGSLQHTGDNVLRLVKNLVEAEELARPKTGAGKTMFFDVFGLFFVHYTMKVSAILNSVLAAVSLVLMVWACVSVGLGGAYVSLLYVTFLAFIVLLGWIVAASVALLTAAVMDATNRSMSWYSVPALDFPLYVAPACASMLITTVIVNRVIRHRSLTLTGKVLMQVHVTRLIWTLILVAMTAARLRITIAVAAGVLFNSIAMLVVHATDAFKPKFARRTWPIVYIAGTIVPTMIVYLGAYRDVVLFTPIFGRYGAGTNPDLLVALFVSTFVVAIGSYYVPLFTYLRRPWYVIVVLGAFYFAGIVLAYTPVGFPYTFSETNPKPQRYSVYHTSRTIRDDLNGTVKSDSGFYLFRNDRNVPHSLEGHVSFLRDAVSLKDDCRRAPGCGVPLTDSGNIKDAGGGIWIPSRSSPFDSAIDWEYSKVEVSPGRRRYSVRIGGSDRIDLYLSIRNGYSLAHLSLVDEVPARHINWNGQVTYYVSFVYGKDPEELRFSFDVESGSGWSGGAVVDLSITTKFVHEDLTSKTDEYREFLEEFPEWTVLTVAGLAQCENVFLT